MSTRVAALSVQDDGVHRLEKVLDPVGVIESGKPTDMRRWYRACTQTIMYSDPDTGRFGGSSSAGQGRGAAILLAILVGLYPGLFFLSNNWPRVGGVKGALQLLLVFACVSSVALAMVAAVLRIFVSEGASRRRLQALAGVLFVVLMMRRGFAPLWEELVLQPVWFKTGVAIACATILGIVLSRLRAAVGEPTGPLIAILGGLSVLTMILLVVRIAQPVPAFEEWQDNVEYPLKDRPNIVVLVPDGYPDRRSLDQVFGHDNEPFLRELERRDFRVYEGVFSGYGYTTAALPAVLNMQHHYYTGAYGSGEYMASDRVIAGRNLFSHILRGNAYDTHLIPMSDLLLNQQCFSTSCDASAKSIRRMVALALGFDPAIVGNAAPEDMFERARELLIAGSPKMIYLHFFMPGHSPNVSTAGVREEWRRRHSEKIEDVNRILLDGLDEILRADPLALIVVVSDHGGGGLTPWLGRSPGDLGDRLIDGDATAEQIRDRFGILLAVRWPASYDGRFDTSVRTSTNILRLVLAYLGDDEGLLLGRADDSAFYRAKNNTLFQVVENGTILPEARVLAELPK